MDGFREAIDTCGLIDIGYKGVPWIFEKKVAGGTFTRVRLDQCVASVEWCLNFPLAQLEHYTAATSDHSPLVLTVREVHACKSGPRAFKYETMWETHDGLSAVIRDSWGSGRETTVQTFKEKLQSLSGDLGAWDRDVFGNAQREIRCLSRN
ncbi:uncharacterized protein [Aegilops tauschii subsp. strangulata]|uniref:uncharacterized protein n=1 Tax=Aegilops tauschii subsp. strangulata TaxID=200361 RepID=UPI003CC8A396